MLHSTGVGEILPPEILPPNTFHSAASDDTGTPPPGMLDDYLPSESDTSDSQQAGLPDPADSDSIADADDADISMINLILDESDSAAPAPADSAN